MHEVRRIRLADGTPIAMEHSLFPASLFEGMLERRLDGSLYELLETQYGQRPTGPGRAWSRSPPGSAKPRRCEVAEGAPLMLVQRTAYAESGTPLEFARDLFRGDRTRLVMWTSDLAD